MSIEPRRLGHDMCLRAGCAALLLTAAAAQAQSSETTGKGKAATRSADAARDPHKALPSGSSDPARAAVQPVSSSASVPPSAAQPSAATAPAAQSVPVTTTPADVSSGQGAAPSPPARPPAARPVSAPAKSTLKPGDAVVVRDLELLMLMEMLKDYELFDDAD